MQDNKAFNPIATAKTIERSYREYIATTIHFDDPELQNQLEQLLSRRGYLAKGPFLEAAPPYVKMETPRQLVESGELCRSVLTLGNGDPHHFDPDRPLYAHQVRAIRKTNAGHNIAVVTGTGSGKTECFLIPMLNDILAEFERDGFTPGVRALILYPMNALANDQLKRLRELLEGTPITFGRYTGDTEEYESKAINQWLKENPGGKKLPNEIISREEIRKNPPNILLTNYSMLEYLLLRPKDAPLFGSAFGSKWRHIAIDEAHVYTGALGTEIAFLLRRLKARIACETGDMPKLKCYATSATIGTEEDMPKVAKFAQDLFGEPFAQEGDIDVITSAKDWPEADLLEPWGTLDLEIWPKLRSLLADENVSWTDIRDVLNPAVPAKVLDGIGQASPLLALGKVLLGEQSTAILVRETSSKLIDLTSLDDIEALGIPDLCGDDRGVDILSSMVDVLSLAQRSVGVPILSSRYHSFLKAPEGLYINLWKKKLIAEKSVSEDCGFASPVPVYEVSVCRHCGQAYILGAEENGRDGLPPWLNPRHEGTDQDGDFIPRKYYRLLSSEEDLDEEEQLEWLCPICGSRHSERDGKGHRFDHPEIARIPIAAGAAVEDNARCGHCGYQSGVAIQPMRVSPEAAGSVVCYDLVRDVPPFKKKDADPNDLFAGFEDEERRAGSVICFSDRRQDAAFFAPAMERTYGSVTVRQIIREGIEACSNGDSGCSPSAVVNWITSIAPRRYPGLLGTNGANQAIAWLIDELEAEDSRNSLDGLGVARIEPSVIANGMKSEQVRKIIAKCISQLPSGRFPWLSQDDFALLAIVCLETLRERGAIEVPVGVDTLRQMHAMRPMMAKGSIVVEVADTSDKNVIQFVGKTSSTENKRSEFLRKYAKRIHGADLSRDDSALVLQSLYLFLSQYLQYLGKHTAGLFSGNREGFKLGMDLWTLYPGRKSDTVYVCDTCGCESHIDTQGVCTTSKCQGHMVKTTVEKAWSKDRYYKDVYCEEALPLKIEEHTAQLSSDNAREIQNAFIQGDVNVLSCTTTFELGVDVGDLRSVFMRNVPPSTANYAQRAGRVGRRAGMPGYAVTFARLRPHDTHFYADPPAMIAGSTRVPACYLSNAQIAKRHVYAVALSEFFRNSDDSELSKKYNGFLALSQSHPQGMDNLKAYFKSRPPAILSQLQSVFEGCAALSDELAIDTWGWVDELFAEGDPKTGEGMGRIVRMHAIKHGDYAHVNEGYERALDGGDRNGAGNLLKTLDALEKEETIGVLAENGILPKYGFPTDLIELHLPVSSDRRGEGKLSLQRGMRQAIREYAPGAEIVAGKTLWRSIGIRRVRGQKLIVRKYGKCPNCESFAWPIDNYSDEYECPVCKTSFTLNKRMLIPSFGFEGEKENKGIGLRRPRSRGFAEVFFSQHWPLEVETKVASFDGGYISYRYANNGELCLANTGGRGGFHVCSYCGAASIDPKTISHREYCKRNVEPPFIEHYQALGASFTSDVLELGFSIGSSVPEEAEAWESAVWAIFAAASQILEIPETELGGTMYADAGGKHFIMLYDNVPGGAGHVLQLVDHIDELIERAYDIVANCSCGEETCCYGCIANYYNQGRQAQLSRGSAKMILGTLLGKVGDSR